MNSDRRKRRQEQRRLKRDVMQNHMVLRGWVPVKCGDHYGLAHFSEQRLVLREWMRGLRAVVIQRGWNYTATSLDVHKYPAIECAWNDLQAQWMRGLRAVVIQRGWL